MPLQRLQSPYEPFVSIGMPQLIKDLIITIFAGPQMDVSQLLYILTDYIET